MRIDSKYKLREIAGETIIVSQGRDVTDMTKIISFNSSARFLFESLTGKEFTKEEVAELLVCEYGIDKEKAIKDASKWIESLIDCKIILL